MALPNQVDISLAAISEDPLGCKGNEFGQNRPELKHRHRQYLQIADVVGFSSRGSADRLKIGNVERDLHIWLVRHRSSLMLKRVGDIVGASLALLLLAPLLSLVAIIVRLSTPGPVIFSQVRHGLHGRPFRVYKFRTLFADRCDASGVAQTLPDDSRVTPIGRLLRRTNVDELPQLWNVLKGDMSLVGPRPHPVGMLAAGMPYEDLVRVYPLRTMVKPGITGFAQLSGYRGPTRDARAARMRVVCDLVYIANFSILFDLKIIVFTVWRELCGGTGS
jgi:polysaccharide biosynthesis protein PslA